MKRTTVNLSTLSLALAAALPALSALSAQAQESAPGSSAATLDAVKVTARKREETLQSTFPTLVTLARRYPTSPFMQRVVPPARLPPIFAESASRIRCGVWIRA